MTTTTTRKSTRVSLRASDAIHAFVAMRRSIEDDDRLLASQPEYEGRERTIEFREEQWQAYQRIAKALGLKPTLTTAETTSAAPGG